MDNEAVITKRPNLRRALEAFMRKRGIQGYTGMSRDFILAGFPERMYYQKLNDWVDRNQGVPDRFFYWLDKTYKLTPKESGEIWDAYRRDLFADPRLECEGTPYALRITSEDGED
jgi:hypothetical protein